MSAALGLTPLRGGATAAAVSSTRLRIAEETGALAVKVAAAQPARTLQDILSRESFINAIIVLRTIRTSNWRIN
jgi:dihydroxy-acid dehydratase